MPTTRDLDAELDERLQRYAASGMSRAGMLAQLNLAGYPTDKLRERFPEMSARRLRHHPPRPATQANRAGQRPPATKPLWQNQPRKAAAPRTAIPSRSAGPSAPTSVFSLSKHRDHRTHARDAGKRGGGRRHLVPLRAADPVLIPTRRSWRRAHLRARTAGSNSRSAPRAPKPDCLTACPPDCLRFTPRAKRCAPSHRKSSSAPRCTISCGASTCQSHAAIAVRLRVYANQLLKLIHCTLTIDENIKDASGRTGLHIRQALFAEEARLWWDDARGVGQGSSLVLSSVLFIRSSIARRRSRPTRLSRCARARWTSMSTPGSCTACSIFRSRAP